MNSLLDHKEDRGVRAVSPVVANVIMAAAVIAVGIVVLAWATSTFSSHQSGAGAFLLSRGEALKESFVIEDVWFYESSSKYVNVTVRNVGTVSLQIEDIYMDDEKIWDENRWIEVGEAVTIEVAFSWDAGEHSIVVATARGNQVGEWYNASG